MNRFFKYTLPAVALCSMLAACSDKEEVTAPVDSYNGKELISFGGDGSGLTRAFFNDSKQGFSAVTKVYMRIKATDGTNTRYAEAEATASENNPAEGTGADAHSSLVGAHSDLTYNDGQERYWDDAFGRASQLSVYAFAIPNRTDATLPTWTKTSWTQVSATNNRNWYTAGADDKTVTWTVSAAQYSTTMDAEDLAYSNNIQEGGTGGRYTHTYSTDWTTSIGDGYMRWIPKTNTTGETTGKFDQGHLIFNHALAWIEINLKEGDGFDNSANTDFVWTSGNSPKAVTQNITLKTFYTSGTLDVSTGTWSGQTSSDITSMNETTGTPLANQTTRKVEALVVPGNNLFETTSNVVEFQIDEGKYYVTGKQIAEAIRDYYKTGGAHENDDYAAAYRAFTITEAGKHYVINLTVAKKGVERITAAILPWETVNSSDADAKNTYPTFTFEDRGTRYDDDDAPKFNLYRVAKKAANFIDGETEANYEWTTGYGAAATKTWQTTSSEWKTDWFWENNLTYYHFRAAGNTENSSGTPSITINPDETNGDNFAITSGAISGSNYKDYIWGAPFKDIDASAKLTYSKVTGFDNETTSGEPAVTTHQIAQAIGTTESQINMLLFHMTSQIFVNVKTTTDASKVVLDTDGDNLTNNDKTKVEILNFLPDGKVLMGNGLVETTSTDRTAQVDMTYGTWAAASGSEPDKVTGYSYGIVPQPLTWTSPTAGTIGLRITTPDGNQYVVKDLSTCTASVSTTNLSNPYTASGSLYIIDRWYPNYQYTYTITLKKTGIQNITAAVLPWETVTGDLGTITLEN